MPAHGLRARTALGAVRRGGPCRLLSGALAAAVLLLMAPVVLLLAPPAARAGQLDAAAMRALFPSPLVVGAKEADLPAWPIFKQNGPATDLVGYAFESIDLAPIPGFSGTPINLLVAIDPDGRFLDVRVLAHHEPVFLDGLGEEPMVRFAAQYAGLSLKQNIRVTSGAAAGRHSAPTAATIDGVAKATASVRIIHQSILAAALRVARARLGYAGGGDPDLVAHVRADRYAPRDFAALLRLGLVQRCVVTNRDADAAFAATAAAADRAAGGPDDPFVELYVALASVPEAGRNLFDPRGWRQLVDRTRDGDHVLFVYATGPWRFGGDDFVRGAVPERLVLAQGGLPIEMRDLDLDAELVADGAPGAGAWKAFRIIAQAGLDPGRPLTLSARVTRTHGTILPERVVRDFAFEYRLPDAYFIPGSDDQKGWRSIWTARAAEIATVIGALALLALLLARGAAAVTDARQLRIFRPLFLLFTLGFIGWVAQGQLSIVNLVALLQAALAGRGWGFFLFDPITTVLWVFVLGSLFAWGRGTFCGWLCPFGALQELVALAARPLQRLARGRGAPTLPLRVPAQLDRRLKRVKYGVLALILGAALASPRAADALVEIEPFKTAITLVFVRAWPFVLYAGVLVAACVVVYKPFCRYLCPLGAGLAALDGLRRRPWIARRAECGTPCQTCRHRCDYQAIAPAGTIDYRECFQCMECVAIHDDAAQCAPRILELKGRAAVWLKPAAAGQRAAAAPHGAVPQAGDGRHLTG